MDEVIEQMGLLLTRLDATRRAVEDIARNSARYTSLAFTEAFTTTAGVGAPPLHNGALMVHIVNIRDLTPSGGFVGFFEGLLGGIGRLVGGAIGGIVGGTISGLALPVIVWRLAAIVDRLAILSERFGFNRPPAEPQRQGGEEPPSITEVLTRSTTMIDLVTGLFRAASGGPGAAGERSATSLSPAGQQWLAILRSVEGVLAGIDRVVRGLVLLIPIVVGSVALFVDRLADIRLAIVEVLQFAVRNLLILRGTIFVVAYDLLASVARLASAVLRVAATAVRGVLTGVFDIAATVLTAGLEVFRFLAGGVQRIVTQLLNWIVSSMFTVLKALGELRVFKVITHFIRILPAVLIPLHELLRDTEGDPSRGIPATPPLSTSERTALLDAYAIGRSLGPSTGPAPPSGAIAPLPNVASTFAPASEVTRLRRALGQARTGLITGVDDIAAAGQRGLQDVSTALRNASARELNLANTELAGNLAEVRRQSASFAGAMREAQIAATARPETGLESIARAYEEWLTGRGLSQVLDNLTQLFRQTPATDTRSIPGAIVGEPVDRPRASVEIEDVVIDLSDTGAVTTAGLTDDEAEALYENFIDWLKRRETRGDSPLLPASAAD